MDMATEKKHASTEYCYYGVNAYSGGPVIGMT